MNYYQHGDCLLFKTETLPKGAKKLKTRVVHKGLNHSHDHNGKGSLYAHGDDLYLKAEKGCAVSHGEHKPIKLPVGIYKKSIVLEYDHFLEESRQVID